jgi:hypothetical protein
LCEDRVVGLDAGFDHLVSQLFDPLLQRVGHRALDVLLAHVSSS